LVSASGSFGPNSGSLDLDEERAMTQGGVTCIRATLAFVIGVGLDFILFAEAYPYGERSKHQNLADINVYLVAPLLALVCAFALGFKGRASTGKSPAPGAWLRDLDSRGFLIPSALVIGLTLSHTIVLIRDVINDPTTHSLLPFEYIIAWLAVGLPALAGSMLARAMSWAVNRVRAQ
jgi:hypothetical protein